MERTCLSCKSVLGGHFPVGEPPGTKPGAGDLMLCATCSFLCMITEDDSRPLTPQELSDCLKSREVVSSLIMLIQWREDQERQAKARLN